MTIKDLKNKTLVVHYELPVNQVAFPEDIKDTYEVTEEEALTYIKDKVDLDWEIKTSGTFEFI